MTTTDSAARSVEAYLDFVVQVMATDLLLTVGAPPLVRIGGELRPIPNAPVATPALTERAVDRLLQKSQRAEFEAGNDVDFAFTWRGRTRLRGNAFRQRDTAAIALRRMPSRIPTFDELGLPEPVRRLAALDRGLLVVSGPTGSGKSTTMASLIDWINENRSLHILTIEDPIEFLHTHKRCAVNQRAIGYDTDSFASALRSAVREDPDILLVGELRDLESIRFALTLAETGHLVMATLHTNDTAQTVDRLVDVFPTEQQPQVRVQLATTLAAIVHQRLLPRAGGGLVAAFEVLIANPPIQNLIAEGKTTQIRNQLMTFQSLGMQTLESSLSALLAAGLISMHEALAQTRYPGEIDPGGVPESHTR